MGVSPRFLADQKGRAQGSWMGAGTAVMGLSLEDVFFTHGRVSRKRRSKHADEPRAGRSQEFSRRLVPKTYRGPVHARLMKI